MCCRVYKGKQKNDRLILQPVTFVTEMFLLSEFQELNVLGCALGEFFVLLDDFHGCIVGVHVTLACGDDGLLVVAVRAVALDGCGSLVELVGQDVGDSLVFVAGAGQLGGGIVILAVEDVEGAPG